MNRNTEYDIVRGTEKLCSQARQLEEISSKAQKLERQVLLLQQAIQKESSRILDLGLKKPRQDGKPELPESVNRRNEYNTELQLQKLKLVRGICQDKKVWEKIENLLPDAYRDENISQ